MSGGHQLHRHGDCPGNATNSAFVRLGFIGFLLSFLSKSERTAYPYRIDDRLTVFKAEFSLSP